MVNENLQAVRELLEYWDKESLRYSLELAEERLIGTEENCDYMNHRRAMKNYYRDKAAAVREVLNLLGIKL